jgi:phosphate/sulfate permease
MIARIERLLIALMFALLAAGVTLVIASAKDGPTGTSAQIVQPVIKKRR